MAKQLSNIEKPSICEAIQTASTAGIKLCGIAIGRAFSIQKRIVFIQFFILYDDAKVNKKTEKTSHFVGILLDSLIMLTFACISETGIQQL
jgi:hypothetical protein